MFTVKVIKKHGVPYGTPEVLAYVDPDAVGEQQLVKMYYHHIILDYGEAIVINDSSTAFNTATFAKWLKDNSYTATGSKKYFASPARYSYFLAATHTLYKNTNLGYYSSNGSTISAEYNQTAISVADGQLTSSFVSGATSSVSVVTDKILEFIV